MSFESVYVSLAGVKEIKVEEGSWNEACEKELNPEVSDFLDRYITPSAFQTLIGLPSTLSPLFKALSQQLCHTPLYEYNRQKDGFCRTADKKARNDLKEEFSNIKDLIHHNMMVQKLNSSRKIQSNINDFDSLSFVLIQTKGTSKFAIMQKTTISGNPHSPDVRLFYHANLKMCALIILPKDVEDIHKKLHIFLIHNAMLMSMNNICAQCGKCSNDLMDCSDCRATRYCDSECQKLHWQASHKDVCRKRKAVLEERKQKLRAMGQRLIRRCMKIWMSRHSFPVRPKSERPEFDDPADSTKCVEETDAIDAASSELESLLQPVMSMVSLGRPENSRDQDEDKEADSADSDGAKSVD